jgi:tellurite resistance protein
MSGVTWQTPPRSAQSQVTSGKREEQNVDKPKNDGADWILKAMVAVAGSDGQLDERETGLIQQVYRDQSGRSLTAGEVERAAEAVKGDLFAEFAAAAKVLDLDTKEEMIRAAYLVLLADERIAGEERKKLKDIAAALQIPEIHFGAILEDLALWLAKARS